MDYYDDILNQAELILDEQLNLDKSRKIKYSCECPDNVPLMSGQGIPCCLNCGTVLENIDLSFENESQIYGTGEDGGGGNAASSRCSGITDTLLGKNVSATTIRGDGKMQNLQFWLSFDYEDTVMMSVKKIYGEAVISLQLPTKIILQASHLYKLAFNIKINGKKLVVRGKNKVGILAGCLYYCIKQTDSSISVDSIIKYFKIDSPTFTKNCRILQENLKNELGFKQNKLNPEKIHRACNELGIQFKLQKICKKIVLAFEELEILENIKEKNLIYSSILFVCKETKNQINIADISEQSKISKDILAKYEKVISENKMVLFNHIKKN